MYNLIWILVLVSLIAVEGKTYDVSSSSELKKAFNQVVAGDVINMAMGEYTSEYTISSKNGTETNPITLTGPRTAIISNYGGLTLFGSNYWILDGFSVVYTNGTGILLDYSSFNILTNLNVSYTGTAAIRIRNNSTDNTVQSCTITHTGIDVNNNGEGVYIGAGFVSSDGKTHSGEDDHSSRNRVVNNHIGPYVRYELVDIKAGVDSVLVENNTLNGFGMKSDILSWVSVKGFNCTIRNNNGVTSPQDGFWVERIVKDNPLTNSGCFNSFIGNSCGDLGKNGKCVNFAKTSCTNVDQGNTNL